MSTGEEGTAASGTRLLVVEDDVGLQETLRDVLELEGYQVETAKDGIAALENVSRRAPALIILDLMMPRMDGVAFADELRRRGLRPAIPILVLSGHNRARSQAARIAAEGCLEKPFDLRAFLSEIQRLSGA